MLVEVEFEVKKNTKDLNILVNFMQNTSVVKNIVKSRPINFSGERDTKCVSLPLCKRLICDFEVRQSSVAIKITNNFCVISII
jgi:hypothetical protein